MRDLLNSPMSVGLEIYGPPEEDFAAIDSHQMNTSGDSKREYEKTFSSELPRMPATTKMGFQRVGR